MTPSEQMTEEDCRLYSGLVRDDIMQNLLDYMSNFLPSLSSPAGRTASYSFNVGDLQAVFILRNCFLYCQVIFIARNLTSPCSVSSLLILKYLSQIHSPRNQKPFLSITVSDVGFRSHFEVLKKNHFFYFFLPVSKALLL